MKLSTKMFYSEQDIPVLIMVLIFLSGCLMSLKPGNAWPEMCITNKKQNKKKILCSVQHVCERIKSKQSVNIKDSLKTGVG